MEYAKPIYKKKGSWWKEKPMSEITLAYNYFYIVILAGKSSVNNGKNWHLANKKKKLIPRESVLDHFLSFFSNIWTDDIQVFTFLI